MSHRAFISLACFAAASIWPRIVTTFEWALLSPLERATQASFCGSPDHAAYALLGHCAACWAGSALLIAAGLAVLFAGRWPKTIAVR